MRARRAVGFIALLFLLSIPLHADSPGVYAITNATVHPVGGADIPNGVVIIRDGLIEAVGAGIAIPADATTIDAKGGHVYPGLIDAQTSIGFPSANPARRRGAGGGPPAQRPQSESLPETSAAFVAAHEAKPSDDDIEAKRGTGVTTILTAPAFGIFNGQSVVLNLSEGSMQSRVIKNPATIQLSFSPRAAWTFPDSLMGVIAYMRQSFFDAQQYAAAHAIYDKNPAGYQRPDDNAALQALGMALRKDVPVVFIADSDLMMRRAQAIASEFGLRYVLSGARQSYRMSDELKKLNVPVLVSVHWATAPSDKEDREEQPLRMIRDRQMQPTSPAALAKSGVLFALVSGPAKTSEFLGGIRKAIENGLTADDALRATTINPARILGIDRQLGTIEKGKIANVVVSDKPIFTKESKLTHIFVDGREAKLPSEEDKKKGAATAGETGPLDGTWSMSVRTPDGDVSFSMTLRVENGKITGSYSSDRGSGDVRNGTFDGTTAEFSVTARAKAETDEWLFHGTLSGSSMSGTVTTTLGTFQFTGSKGK
jgi:hypothetical protein